MNFTISLGTGNLQEFSIVNASSWSNCLAYCEGTGLQINSIQFIPNSIIVHNTETTNCFQVLAKSSEGTNTNYLVWENTFDDLTTWINSQSFQSVLSIQLSNKSYVVV